MYERPNNESTLNKNTLKISIEELAKKKSQKYEVQVHNFLINCDRL